MTNGRLLCGSGKKICSIFVVKYPPSALPVGKSIEKNDFDESSKYNFSLD